MKRIIAALVLVVGVVLSPLNAMAATVPQLFTYDGAVPRTAAVRVEAESSLRSERGGVPEYVYDTALVTCEEPSNLHAIAGARAVRAYDAALAFLDRREARDGVFYAAPAATVAAEATQLELPLVEDATLTRGTFARPDGSTVPLASGWKGGPGPSMPSGSPGFDIVTRTHVEGHAAALMNQEGLSSGRLFINNPTICPSCSKLLRGLRRALPTDWSVTANGAPPVACTAAGFGAHHP